MTERILIVDDDPMVRGLFRGILRSEGHTCVETGNGSEALALQAASAFALIIVDIRMPEMSGVELLQRLRAEESEAAGPASETAIIMVTGAPDVESAVETLKMGAYDYVSKPIDLNRFLRTVHNALERRRLLLENREYQRGLEELIDRRTNELLATCRETLAALGSALDTRDPETQQHTQRVTRYTTTIARSMGVHGASLRDMEWGAMVHDVGKIGIPDGILLKPGPLDAHEWTVMRRHPLIGYRLLKDIPFLRGALSIVRHHHEAWNGKGYPDGLSGEEIPLGARIFKAADVFDALTSPRPYRSPDSPEKALDTIVAHAGTEFDPLVVEAFKRCFPVLLEDLVRFADSDSPLDEVQPNCIGSLPR